MIDLGYMFQHIFPSLSQEEDISQIRRQQEKVEKQ